MNKIYLIDTNILIEAKNRYYAFTICPGFWELLITHNSNSFITSIDKVKLELNKGDDELKNWINNVIPASFFKSTNEDDIMEAYKEIVNWVQVNNQFYPEAKAEFIQDICDPYIIAYAKVKNCVLISNEVLKPEAKSRVPIPNVCTQFDVEYENPFKMLEILGTQFILKS